MLLLSPSSSSSFALASLSVNARVPLVVGVQDSWELSWKEPDSRERWKGDELPLLLDRVGVVARLLVDHGSGDEGGSMLGRARP